MDFFQRAKKLIIPKPDFDLQLGNSVNQLGNLFFEKVELVFEDRKNDLNNSNLTEDQIEDIINKYAQQNMIIAASAAAVPGPLGIIAMGAEFTSLIGNQLKMTYDIACAYDKENLINKDLLIDIPLHAMGINTNLDQIQNYTPDQLLESPTDLLKEKTTQLARKIATKSVKKSFVKFIPVAGSVLMSIWTKTNTQKVSQAAVNFFDKNKTIERNQKGKINPPLLEQLHLQALLNLMKADAQNTKEEIEFITPMIEHSNLSLDSKNNLLNSLNDDSIYKIDFQAFINSVEQKEALITDLIVLYKRDNEIHQNEIDYIFKTGEALGFEKKYIQDLLDLG